MDNFSIAENGAGKPRFNAIRERLSRYTDEKTNTDEKLENGAISDWTFHGDEDMAWLVERFSELLKACATCERLLLDRGDPFRGDDWQAMQDVRAAIAKACGE